MAYTAKGKIIVLNDAQQVTDKFKKREFVIQEEEEIHGNVYTNAMPMQFVNDQCSKLDSFKVGDEVTVTFHPKGNKWEKAAPTEENPNAVKSGWNLNLAAISIALVAPAAAPAPIPSPAPAVDGLPF